MGAVEGSDPAVVVLVLVLVQEMRQEFPARREREAKRDLVRGESVRG